MKTQGKHWEQHYPTYEFSERDIALEEYKEASKCLASEERVFLNASNIIVLSLAALGSLAVGSSEKIIKITTGVIPSWSIYIILIIMTFMFTLISLKYFTDRQKSITFASRKVVVLRRMLGLSYGHINLILPNWRVEGADQAMSIKILPSLLSSATYPFWLLNTISSCIFLLLSSYMVKYSWLAYYLNSEYYLIPVITILWFLYFSIFFRQNLFEENESYRLLISKYISKIINLKLVYNIEYILYRAKLSAYEAERLKINFKNLKKILIFVEDRDYYRHNGISYKSIFRALLGVFKIKRKSGGSTITQQLLRTLFIKDMHKSIRRKIIEIILSPWLSKCLEKDDLLNIYLSSVRFEKGCLGIIKAMKYFFGNIIINPTNAESFFLIERLSNIKSSLLVNKIIDTVTQAYDNNIIDDNDIHEISKIYTNAVNSKKIITTEGKINDLQSKLLNLLKLKESK